jgi:hypothetical protein
MNRTTPAGALLALALAAVLPLAGCESAVKHPAVTAGIVGGTLGFTTCKLGSDNNTACLAVTAGTAAFLGLVAAAALWLGGDGNPSVIEEEPVQPLPTDEPPGRRRHPPPEPPPAEPAPAAPGPSATPAPATPVSPSSGSPAPAPSAPATPPVAPPPPSATSAPPR